MAYPVSPGVTVNEVDINPVVVGAATDVGAIAGVFRWGPVNERVLHDSEEHLVQTRGMPTNLNYETFFTGANFLAYSSAMYSVRAANTTGLSPIVTANVVAGNTVVNVGSTTNLTNGMILVAASNTSVIRVGTTIQVVNATHVTVAATSDAYANGNAQSLQFVPNTTAFNAFVNTASVSNISLQIIKSEDHFAAKLEDGDFDSDVPFIAKWPGLLGNSLKVSAVDSETAFSSNLDLSVSGAFTGNVAYVVDSNTATVTIGANTSADGFNVNSFNTFTANVYNSLTVGDFIESGNVITGTQNIKISAIGTAFANVGLASNSAVNTSITSGNPTLTTTGNAFSALSNGDYIAVFANATYWESYKVLSTLTTNTVTLAVDGGFTLANAVWTTVNASSRSLTLSLEDKYKRSTNTSLTYLSRMWEYFDTFDVPPDQSSWVYNNGNTAANDEMHLVVVDEDGKFTGVPGTILEKWTNLSRVEGAKNDDGEDNYYKTVINSESAYIWAPNDRSGAASNDALNITSSTNRAPYSASFALGQDGSDESSIAIGLLTTAYDEFVAADEVDVSLIMTGKSRGGTNGAQLANYLIDNVAEIRKDAVVFVSPEKDDVVNNAGSETDDIVDFRNSLRVSSYGFLDSGYKYQYDRYNDVYRFVPLNGDIAGLAARTENTNDAWWSFAGFNRGQIKNIVKLAWNPRKAYRDVLYKNSINPVVTFPGEGTLLYGDKTLLSKPSAFDRINVRRLFIVLEKSIARSARYTLFEFNDSFTRAQFRNLIIPFLRDVQGRRGIYDFAVICDDTNNTPQVIDTNRFKADIYVKPARSINFIELTFFAVPTGVAFTEVIRKA